MQEYRAQNLLVQTLKTHIKQDPLKVVTYTDDFFATDI
jgi:hypothetical protein